MTKKITKENCAWPYGQQKTYVMVAVTTKEKHYHYKDVTVTNQNRLDDVTMSDVAVTTKRENLSFFQKKY